MKRGNYYLCILVAGTMMFQATLPVHAETVYSDLDSEVEKFEETKEGSENESCDTDFDLSNFYVCDEFLENGTSGGDIDEVSGTGVRPPDLTPVPDTLLEEVAAVVQPLHMSAEGIAMLEGFEGLRLTAYKALSTEKYYTIGYGHYGPDVTEGMTITQAQAEELLRQDLASRENYLNSFASTNGILFRQNEFDAILSLIFNIGTGNFSDSTIRRYIIEGFENHTDEDYTTAIGMWRKSGGQVVQGLVNRRAKESAYFTRYGVKRPQMREASLGLNGRVGLYLYMYIPEKITAASGAYILNVTDAGPQYRYLSEMPHEGQMYCVSNDFRPKEINNTVAIALVDASGVMYPIINSNTNDGFTYIHSLEKFRSSALAAGQTNLVKLADSVREYGNCAWAYFNDYAYAPAGEINTVNAQDFSPYEMERSGAAKGLTYVGSSLILESGTSIRHYFALGSGYAPSDYKFEIRESASGEAQAISLEYSNGLYYVTISNISPVDYDKMFIVSAQRAGSQEGEALTIKYGVYSYGYKLLNTNGNELLKNVLKAMRLYGKAASSCFQN